MALNDYETSVDRGQPVELYQFVYGIASDGVTPLYYAYTDAEMAITHDGITYEPVPISRSKIKSDGKMDAKEVEVVLPRTAALGDLFRTYPPSSVVSLRLRQGHVANEDDPVEWADGENWPVAWLGRVLEAVVEGPQMTLTCEPASASMERPGLRRNYQRPCPLALYGPRCGADKARATTTGTVSSASGNRVTLQAGWMLAPDPGNPDDTTPEAAPVDYTGGLASWLGDNGEEHRTILRVEGGNTLVLHGIVRDLAPGDSLSVALGCPHTTAGCLGLHDNIVNYGGQPVIPGRNPVGKNNHF